MQRKKWLFILVASLAFCLSACNTTENNKQNTVAGTAVEQLFTIDNNGKESIVNGAGKLILQGKKDQFRIIRDGVTQKPAYIAEIQYEDSGKRNEYDEPIDMEYKSALYDVEGNVLRDMDDVFYSFAWGDYLWVQPYDRDKSYLLNAKTNEIVYDNLQYYNQVGNSLALVDKDENWLILDENGQEIAYREDIDYAYTGLNDAYIIYNCKDNPNLYGIMDENWQILIPCQYESGINLTSHYAVVQKGNVSQVIDLPSGEVVLSMDDAWQRYIYFDGGVGLLQSQKGFREDGSATGYSVYMVNNQGETISDMFDYITYEIPKEDAAEGQPDYFIGTNNVQEGQMSVTLMDRTGQVLYQKTAENIWLSQCGKDRFVVSGYHNDGTNTVYSCSLIDQTGREVIPIGKYDSIYTVYSDDGAILPYVFGAFLSSQNNMLINLLDLDGNIIISNLRQYYNYTGGYLVASKGFYVGLMDMQGNWLYKESIFSGLDQD